MRLWAALFLVLPAYALAASFDSGSFDTGSFDTGSFDLSSSDSTAPTIVGAEITNGGDGLRWTPSESITDGGATTGATLSCDGGAVNLTYVSAGLLVDFTTDRTVGPEETCTTGYTQPGSGFQDAAGNLLATFSGTAVSQPTACSDAATYNSTEDATQDATGDMLCVGF